MIQKAACEITQSADVLQLFRAERDHLAVISPFFATYCKTQSSTVCLELFRAPEPLVDIAGVLRDKPVARQTMRCAELHNNAEHEFYVQGEVGSVGKLYLLRISSLDAVSGNAVTVLLTSDHRRIRGHVHCLSAGAVQEPFGLMAHVGYAEETVPSPVPPGLLISPVTQCNLKLYPLYLARHAQNCD